MLTTNRLLVLLLLPALVFTSCQPSKKMHQDRLYLQGVDTALLTSVKIPDPQIQKGDKLSITVFSDNPEATALYNQVQTGSGAGAATVGESGVSTGSGYLVDADGDILFHGLGPLHVEGLTKSQLKQLLQQKLLTYLKNPYAEIRFLNKRITILGEVARPGIINMPEEKLTILDALALSGDLTNFGRKDNILVIREENGKRSYGRLNIKDVNIYKSEYFYLHRDDLVYIEPNRKKPLGTDQTLIRNISITATIISTIAILYSVFKK